MMVHARPLKYSSWVPNRMIGEAGAGFMPRLSCTVEVYQSRIIWHTVGRRESLATICFFTRSRMPGLSLSSRKRLSICPREELNGLLFKRSKYCPPRSASRLSTPVSIRDSARKSSKTETWADGDGICDMNSTERCEVISLFSERVVHKIFELVGSDCRRPRWLQAEEGMVVAKHQAQKYFGDDSAANQA